jgi:hypothetical protein
MTEHTLNLDALKYNIERGGHSVFSPSGSAMWLWCSGSLLANLAAKDQAGEDAAYGTVAHGVAEQWLKSGMRPDYRIGEVVEITEGDITFRITIDLEMLNFVQEYVDWANATPGDHFVERRVYFSRLTPIPKQGGTADHIAASMGHLIITDLKMGMGVQVFAADDIDDPRSLVLKDGVTTFNGNPQAMLYALGTIYELDWFYGFEKITIRIAQPRLGHFQTWETTKTELLRFAEWAKERAFLAWQSGAPRTPSPKGCLWCKVKADCGAFMSIAEAIADDCFDDVSTDQPIAESRIVKVKNELDVGLYEPKLLRVDTLTTDQLAKLVPYRGMFEKWFKAVEEELEVRALAGQKIAGMKLVESRSNRAWKNEEKAGRFLVEHGIDETELYGERKMISPAQAEALLAAKGIKKVEASRLIAKVAHKPTGRPTLAPIADRREALDKAADDCFDDLSDDHGL